MQIVGKTNSALDELIPTHRIFFHALERANKHLRKPASISEIIEALDKKELTTLRNTYILPLEKASRNIINSLKKRNLIFVAHTERKWNYYAAVTIFDPAKTKYVYKSSFRETLIELIREVILYYKRAVRVGDIEKYLNDVRPDLKKDYKWFRAAVHRLANEGIIKVVDKVRQDKYGGNYFLLPDMEETLCTDNVPPSWLELVFNSFQELWKSRCEESKDLGVFPKPLTTDEIKNYIIENHGKEAFPSYKGAVPYALWVLARPNSRTVIRRIKSELRSKHFWVPLQISDDEIDISNLPISDTVKVNSLVRYAVERLNRLVTMVDLAEELKIRPELKINRKKSINSLLNNQSKCSDVKKIGWLYGEWYFYYGDEKMPAVRSYQQLRKIQIEWNNIDAAAELGDLENCKVKSIVYGRCKIITNKIEEIILSLKEFSINEIYGEVINNEATVLLNEVTKIDFQVKQILEDDLINFQSNLRQSVDTEIVGLTVEQLWELLQPLYPKAVQVKKVAEISNILSGDIRRFKNPHYKPSFCDGSLETSQYLFDKTDAFIYAGQKWGESECFMQALMTRNNLGLLRDVNFVLPGLLSEDYEIRLITVSCLAFLQDEKALEPLFSIALNDQDAGVRESAIWAYAFLGGNVKKLSKEVIKRETNTQVLEFLSKVERRNFAEMWFI